MTTARDLFARLQRARDDDDSSLVAAITHEIVLEFMPLAHAIAATIKTSLPIDDRKQEAILALYSAVRSYDASRGEFAPYMSKWIRGAILQAARNDRAVRTPKRVSPVPHVSMDAPIDDAGSTLHDVLASQDSSIAAVDLSLVIEHLEPSERCAVMMFLSDGKPLPPRLAQKLRRMLE